jgi:hypothetical protein
MDNMQLNNIVSQVLDMMLGFTIFFVPCFLGAYAKDFYDIAYNKRKKQINIKGATVAALSISAVAVGFSSFILTKYGLQMTFSVFFMIGAVSNKVVEKIFDGSLLKIVLKFLGKQRVNLQDSIDETFSEMTENKKKK